MGSRVNGGKRLDRREGRVDVGVCVMCCIVQGRRTWWCGSWDHDLGLRLELVVHDCEEEREEDEVYGRCDCLAGEMSVMNCGGVAG